MRARSVSTVLAEEQLGGDLLAGGARGDQARAAPGERELDRHLQWLDRPSVQLVGQPDQHRAFVQRNHVTLRDNTSRARPDAFPQRLHPGICAACHRPQVPRVLTDVREWRGTA